MAKIINGIAIGRPARSPEQIEEDFLSRIEKMPSGCHEWRGTIEKRGYGVLTIEDRQWRAHRYAYVRANGPVSDTLLICHRCNNKLCVNPEHLYAGDDRANGRDKAAAGTSKGERNPGVKLKEADVIQIRELYADGRSQPWIAKRYKIAQTHVSEIVRGIQWSHIGGPIKGKV